VSARALRLTEDRLASHARLALPPAPRVIYALTGAVTVATQLGALLHDAVPATISNGPPTERAGLAAPATITTGAAELTVGEVPATALRFELVAAGAPDAAPAPFVTSRRLLEHALDLDPAGAWLMRCDRVDWAPGGIALPHGHRGGGIRYLLAGTLEVTVGDGPARLMRPGDAWFESGREPVLATASPDAPTAFVRVSILPVEIRGRSSIVYVDPADGASGRPRQYTIYADEPIDLAEAALRGS
jgi:quercetin dioxygenase-like cupin family protein